MPFSCGDKLPPITHPEYDKAFGIKGLADGVTNEVYLKVSEHFAREQMDAGKMISSAFKVWQGEGREPKGRFVLHSHTEIKHWPRRSIKMETVSSIVTEM